MVLYSDNVASVTSTRESLTVDNNFQMPFVITLLWATKYYITNTYVITNVINIKITY